jgi:hypothetical protein
VPPFEETQNYVRNVISLTRNYGSNGVDASYLGRSFGGSPAVARKTEPEPEQRTVKVIRRPEPATKFQVRFKSGTVQQAERVVADGDYYYIDYKGRSFRVRTPLVDSVTPPPLSRAGTERITAKM